MADAMEQLYQQVILDHARVRQGEGELTEYGGESFQINPTCGDQVTLRVRLDPKGERIQALGWTGQGCSISQASLSVMHELVLDQPVARAEELGAHFRELMAARGKELDSARLEALEDASAFTGVARYPARIKCALLGWMALRDALVQARGRA
ncbi:SUF system NifU family Fe-S cluster assembly protein [Nesterenkonia sp. E16_7]|uniref:Fe-S cluster assembly sulfur transfer protein SufU n=1 Tax=unclassified Nesterenkonia TaxID=2629769 RepID=UPI001A92E5C8|nr:MULTISPECIES: SUF system NifU family Fe-S cluster assembly protein [unclassified Nesterenkonia]MBO0596066.1 SUF system NifU family Fe-S cluster assembly protein [Nesterenkonia sp. E16_10]MBO0599332.1 SUF system NifU family Fe-S cluster assembly protein [Nesterenkonia sp. E16_7]